ncbi:MAG: T9SS type A sorting domain-containing protein, partial [Bacteroidia bacterium]|nr:T9SS type A sorting domain-containing protein [Bacteroidia bacterium]
NSNDNLLSPLFDFSNVSNAKLSFLHWMHAEAQWDGGRIDYTTDNGATWNVLGTLNDPKGTNWYDNGSLISTALPGWDGLFTGWVKSEYELDQFNNSPTPVRFRFNFSSDGAVNSFDGWAIDDFKIEMPITVNAQTNTVGAGGPIILPGLKPITANIVNGGSFDLASVDITLEIDGSVIVTDSRTFSPLLPFGSSITHTFSVPWNAMSGCADIRVWTSNPNGMADIKTSDDTSSATFCVFETINTLPYCNDFESGNPWTTYNSKNANSPNSWELGSPSQTNINNAFSGNNAWMTQLNQAYPNEDASVLLTPGFNLTQGKCYKFSFEGNFITETILDGGSIDYSYDDGATWTTFGDTSDANWYNTHNIFSFGSFIPKGGWTGNSNGWQHFENFHIAQSTGVVIFRFWFVSDLTIIDEGWAIDDFCLEELSGNCATSINEINSINLYSVFPNPTSGVTSIYFELSEPENISLQVMDMLGKTVLTKGKSNYLPGIQSIQLNTRDWTEGIYYVTLFTEEHSVTEKLVVIK